MKKARDLMAKAGQAAASARMLLEAGDADGACNRAYYAMFDAARAALLASGGDVGKTHKGVLNAFSDRLVKSGLLPKEMVTPSTTCSSIPSVSAAPEKRTMRSGG